MSLIAIAMNAILAGLLLAAMAVGIRLNRRLKALRDSHEGFETAVRDLNMAAVRAEQGLADLRAATDEATDILSDRIDKGRALALKLERLVSSAPETPRAAAPERPARAMPAAMPAPRMGAAEQRLADLMALARARIAAEDGETLKVEPVAARPQDEPLVGRAALPGRRITSMVDDDLFEDAPAARDSFAGARR